MRPGSRTHSYSQGLGGTDVNDDSAEIPAEEPDGHPPGGGSGLEHAGPTPESRSRGPGVRGTPVELGGATWILADYVPALSEVWDVLHEDNVLLGKYESADVQRAAVRLLFANYELSLDEAVGLVMGVAPADLVAAVEEALFGASQPDRRWSDWVRSSLLANGLDPAKIPPESLRDVLDQLVSCGRAIPAEDFVTAVGYAKKRKSLLAEAEW